MFSRLSYRFSQISLLAVPVLVPLFWLPLTTDFYQINKLTLFYLLTGLGLIGWLAYSIGTKSVRLTLFPPLLPLFLLAAAAIAGGIINRPVPTETWYWTAAIYPAGWLYCLLTATMTQTAPQLKLALVWITAAAGLAGIGGIAEFNPAGSTLNLASLLAGWLPAALVLAFKIKDGPKKIFFFIASGLIVSSLILNGYRLLPGQDAAPVLLPKTAGWVIAVDTLKTKLWLGTGAGRFSESFTRFKPITINQDALGGVLFTVSANVYLEILATLGLVGFAAWIWLAVSGIRLNRRRPGTRITATQLALSLSFLAQLAIGLAIPFTAVNWIMLFTTLALLAAAQKTKQSPQIKDIYVNLNTVSLANPAEPKPSFASPVLPWLVAVPAVIGLTIGFFNLAKAYAADYYYQKSLEAARQNQGKNTYDLQIKAVGLAPQFDRYRAGYSNTNLALANTLAAKTDLSDQEKETVTSLVQQAIREARAATQLAPQKSIHWVNLGKIYRNLINYAEGADQFSLAAYIRAVQLDPANPQLRLELGGLYYALGRYEEATDRFKESIALKSNYANAYYNLAYAFQKQEKWLEAYQAMESAISLLPAESAELEPARAELAELKKKLPQPAPSPKTETPAAPENLLPPSPLPSAPADLAPIKLD